MNLATLKFTHLSNYSNAIGHFITTRQGGVSKGLYSSLNLGLHQEDNPSHVIENRNRVAKELGIGIESMVFAEQVHGCRVEQIHAHHKGTGSTNHHDAISNADGMVTVSQGVCLVTLAADCVPLLLFDPKCNAIGVAHAGWQGTIKDIASEAVGALVNLFGSSPSDILVGIGPAIGPCCYEVGIEVALKFEQRYQSKSGIVIQPQPHKKPKLNLWAANQQSLIEAGVDTQNIEIMELCTKCNNQKFFSARAGDRGRIGAAIVIR